MSAGGVGGAAGSIGAAVPAPRSPPAAGGAGGRCGRLGRERSRRRSGRRGRRRRGGGGARAGPDVLVLVLAAGVRGRLGRGRRRGRRGRGSRGDGLARRGRRRGGRLGVLGVAVAHRALRSVGVELPREVLERHVHGQRQVAARALPRRREPPLVVDQLHVLQEARVAPRLRLERVLVVPAGPAEVRERPPEVERRDLEVRRVGAVEAQRDGGAVVDGVGQVALAQEPPQPLGLGGHDVERPLLRRRRARSACPSRSARPSLDPRTRDRRAARRRRTDASARARSPAPAGTAPRPRTP